MSLPAADLELRWPHGENVSCSWTATMRAIDRMIGEGRYISAARLASRMMEESADTGRRRRYKGLLLFALSRLPEGVRL